MTDPKPDTWMPLVIGDYLKDTTRLTTEQHGAYLLLIMNYWIEGPPPDDDQELAAITGLELKAWARNRAKLQRFFRIEDGVWRHKRVDEELVRWTEKKAKYAARAAAGGRAKAAKSSPQAADKQVKTTGKGCLEAAPQPASTEVDGHRGQSTLCGGQAADERADGSSPPAAWAGPSDVWAAFLDLMPLEWCMSYIAPCAWQDVPERALIPHTKYAGAEIIRHGRKALSKLNLAVLERAA